MATLPQNSGSQSSSVVARDNIVLEKRVPFRDVSNMQQPSKVRQNLNTVPLSNKICSDSSSSCASAINDETQSQSLVPSSDNLHFIKPKRTYHLVPTLPKPSEKSALENPFIPDLSFCNKICGDSYSASTSAINEEALSQSLRPTSDHLYCTKPKRIAHLAPILPKPFEKPAFEDPAIPDLSPSNLEIDFLSQSLESKADHLYCSTPKRISHAVPILPKPAESPFSENSAVVPDLSRSDRSFGDSYSESATARNNEVAMTCGNVSLKNLTCDQLMAMIEEKNRVIPAKEETVQKLTALSETLYRRVGVMRNTTSRHRKELKRIADSNIKKILNPRSKLKKDQITALGRKSTKGMKWSAATIRDALVFKMKMGTRAYADFVKKVPIYPSIRTVQQSVKHLDFDSGILYDVFQAVKDDVSRMPPEMRRCVLGGDEMAIQEAETYDPGSKKMIGKATFEPHSGLAKKAFTVVIGGVAKRYKFTGAYCFTSSVQKTPGKRKKNNPDDNPVGEALKKMIIEVIIAAETIAGLLCDAYISDMGPDNLALWRAVNVGVFGNDRIVQCSIPHPCRPGERFWFLPDTVHLFKNIANSLCINQFFHLSDDVVKKHGLKTDEVRLQHVQELLDHEKGFELKIAHRLNQDNLESKRTFNKMEVTNATAVFSKRTEVGLREKARREKSHTYDATIFFLALIVHWFDLVTNRGAKLRLSPDNEKEYRKALGHIKKTADVFKKMNVGKDKRWKPIRTGMLVACEALLQIQDMYLVVQKILRFLLLGRFTQDFVENLYSLIRFRLSVPNALHVKWNLQVVTLAQICLTAMNSNYFRDTDEDVLLSTDFRAATKKVAEARVQERATDEFMEGAAINVPHTVKNGL